MLTPFCYQETPHLRKAQGLIYSLLEHETILSAVDRIQNGRFSIRIKTYNIAMAGLPDWIPGLIEWMEQPEYAQLVGEAFSFITGADFIEDNLARSPKDISRAVIKQLKQNRKQDPWTQAYEEDLPWPDHDAAAAWWEVNCMRFESGSRYLAGRTLTEENLLRVKEEGTQPQRHQADLWYKKGFVHEYGMSSINNKPKSTRKRPHEALIVSQILLEENVGWARFALPILHYPMGWGCAMRFWWKG